MDDHEGKYVKLDDFIKVKGGSLSDLLFTGDGKCVEAIAVPRDGKEFPCELTYSKLDFSSQYLLVVSVRDISSRKAESIRFLQAQKMDAVGRLAGGIAHDFNNLLCTILGTCGLLLDELPPGHPWEPMLDLVLQAGRRATSLTRQLLSFSATSVVQARNVCVNRTICELRKLLARTVGEKIRLVTDLWPGSLVIRIDPGQLEQVLLNLAVNARDAIGERGGVLRFSTATYPPGMVGDPPWSCPAVEIVVADNGCGMDQEVQRRIFEPFFTTKAPGMGTGLGLATVYSIVNKSGGMISVKSSPGQGTEFRILFPRLQEEADVDDTGGKSYHAARGGETILLVDDEAGVLNTTALILRRKGYNVLTASNGVAAIMVSESHNGPIDLLLSDVVMPYLSGLELAERLTPYHPSMKVLFMTGYMERGVWTEGKWNSNLFLRKPFTVSCLLERVRAVLDGPGRELSGVGGVNEFAAGS